jgi:putative thiamine transport system permease protein
VWLLAGVLVVGLVLACLAWRALCAVLRRRATQGQRGRARPVHRDVRSEAGAALPMHRGARWPAGTALVGVYGAVVLALVLASVTRLWPFPAAWPAAFGWEAWGQVADAGHTVLGTLALAALASFAACAMALLWFEIAPPAWDARIAPLVLAPLVVPPLLWLVGLYRLALDLRLDGSAAGLVWVHALMVLPYSVITLAGAWRSFDPRWQQVAATLGRSRAAFWWRVKLPMLRAPVASALAVGLAVSVAQYLPTLFIGAGRMATVTTEAVTLAAGGQRQTAAALALLQALLPLGAFAAAAVFMRRRGATRRARAGGCGTPRSMEAP